jgi:hypothetical protein
VRVGLEGVELRFDDERAVAGARTPPLGRHSPHADDHPSDGWRSRPWRPILTVMTRQIPRASLVGMASLVAFTALGSSAAKAAELQPPGWALHGSYSPSIDPANFVRRVDSRYFPLKPGTRYHYVGHKGRTRQTDDVVVTHRTKRVLGIRCTVVRDTVSQHGKPVERTFDWYAQDKHGNVWYMGEDSLELKNGHFVRASDSWKSGVDGAKPGIIMRGRPRTGDVYRQEYYKRGQALDQARVLGRTGTVTVRYGTFKRALATSEWSPADPQFEKRYYAPGVGEIAERVVQGGHEGFKLVSVKSADR